MNALDSLMNEIMDICQVAPDDRIDTIAFLKMRAAIADFGNTITADLERACKEGWRYADELEQERKRLEIDAARYRHLVDEALIHEDWLKRRLRVFKGEEDYKAAVNEAVDKSIRGRGF